MRLGGPLRRRPQGLGQMRLDALVGALGSRRGGGAFLGPPTDPGYQRTPHPMPYQTPPHPYQPDPPQYAGQLNSMGQPMLGPPLVSNFPERSAADANRLLGPPMAPDPEGFFNPHAQSTWDPAVVDWVNSQPGNFGRNLVNPSEQMFLNMQRIASGNPGRMAPPPRYNY